jgi:hypothetical protein
MTTNCHIQFVISQLNCTRWILGQKRLVFGTQVKPILGIFPGLNNAVK